MIWFIVHDVALTGIVKVNLEPCYMILMGVIPHFIVFYQVHQLTNVCYVKINEGNTLDNI